MMTCGLICRDCGRTFDEPEYRFVDDALAADERCPFCGSASFTDAAFCEDCDAPVPYEPGLEYQLCSECREALAEQFEALISRTFRPCEIKFLNDRYDGEYFGMKKIKEGEKEDGDCKNTLEKGRERPELHRRGGL